MIQRKQTLFLLLICLISLFCVIKSPFIYQSISFIDEGKSWADVGLTKTFINNKLIQNNWSIAILLMLNILLSFFAIISFKKLKRQLKLVVYIISSSILSFVSVFLIIYSQTEKFKFFDGSYVFNGWIFLILNLIFSFFAFKYIKKDIDLLNSVERLR